MIALQFPDLPILLDHGAMPYGMSQYEVALLQKDGAASWKCRRRPITASTRRSRSSRMCRTSISRSPRSTWSGWSKADVRPADLIRRMVDSFGPDRLMWGSDVGQSMLWSYAEKVAMARAVDRPAEPGRGARFPPRQWRADLRATPAVQPGEPRARGPTGGAPGDLTAQHPFSRIVAFR